MQTEEEWIEPSQTGSGEPLLCLIVEDAVLIALTLESDFEDHGFRCTTVTSSAEAMRWLEGNTPSVAILDYLLKDGRCTPLASVLRERGIPFVIYSGMPAGAACPELRGRPWIAKPATGKTLLRVVADLIGPPVS